MQQTVIDGPGAFDLPEWRELLAQEPHPHVFATPEWGKLWWDHFGEGKQLRTVVFSQGSPAGLASLVTDHTDLGRRVRFIGGDDLTDYLGPLVASDHYLQPVAEGLLRFLSRQTDWDYFDAKCLPVPFRFSEWLVEAADRLGLPFQVHMDEMTAVLALPGEYEEYLRRLPGKKRHELKRKLRRFDENASGAVVRRADDDSVEDDLKAFVDMHRGSEGLKGKFMAPERADFFLRVAHTFHPLGMLSLDFLELEGRKLAATFALRFQNTFYLYNSAYDHGLQNISPGLVLAAKLIERSIAEGLDRFDFLRGRERYKFDLGAEALPLHTVTIHNPDSEADTEKPPVEN